MNMTERDNGEKMYGWAKDLFPVNRSLTGEGVRETLRYLRNLLPGLVVKEIPSGTRVFDWVIPDEWLIRDAYIIDESGKKIVDFKVNNLHVVGYSEPVDMWMELGELDNYLFSLPDQPEAIPYITSYYKRRWGFCLSDNHRKTLKPGRYRVVIDSELFRGVLNYGELVIPGREAKEVLLSTYICHPSMANNELSGPVVAAALGQWLLSVPDRRYTYRIIFIPETIGAVAYIHENLEILRANTIAGFQITCIGDDRVYSFLPSRTGDTLSDRAALHVLKHAAPDFCRYTFLDRGSDERQFCSPGVDLPVASIMRSKYGAYPEYHTSLDNLELISPAGLQGGFYALQKAISVIEENCKPAAVMPCEPQLGKRGLYPNLSSKNSVTAEVNKMMNFLAYADGKLTLLEIAEIIDVPMWELVPIYRKLADHALVKDIAAE